jgi:branched-chain amino acid transport system permease protein/neutral amino acid transport system permease protein
VHVIITIFAFGVLTAALLSIGAVGFTLQFGVTNVMNLAFGALMTSAIFILYETQQAHIPLWIGVALVGVWGAVSSLVLSIGLINPFVRRGTSLFSMAIVTVAAGLIIEFSLEAIQGPQILGFSTQTPEVGFLGIVMSELQLEIIGLAAVLLVAIHVGLRYTRLGLKMRATAADAALTRSCGVSARKVRLVAWAVSGALCGIGGALIGLTVGSFNSTTGNEFFIILVAAAIIGGVGQPYGAMLGALVIGMVSEGAAYLISPAYNYIIAFSVLIIVLLFRPQGLFAEYSSGRTLTQ